MVKESTKNSSINYNSSKEQNANPSKVIDTNSFQELKKKYAKILRVDELENAEIPLYAFIEEWSGVTYQYGGKSKQGIDCSGFASLLYKSIYNIDISGSSENIFDKCNELSKENLQEGDFVFFKIESNKISHVGIYLKNDKFVHATTKVGVIISDLNEVYYKKYYFKGGRLK